MDPALLLLLRLRFWGWLRRMGRKLSTARGILLTAMGMLFFVPSIVGVILAPVPPKVSAMQVEGFRRFAPLGMLAYCLLTLLFSPGEKAFAFSPAEVSFLFPAPFSRRKLLGYKIVGNVALTFLTAIFVMFGFRQFTTNWAMGYLGAVLMFVFLQLFAMAVTVAGQAIGAGASTRRRQLALALIVALAGASAVTVGARAIRSVDLETIRSLEHAPAVRVAVAPFLPFARAISAARVADFLLWGGVALAVDAALIAAILALDAQYLEEAAASSERFYAKLERMRKGGPSATSRRKNKRWKELPALPWWGGAGPILWRQMTTAARDYARTLSPLLTALGVAALGVYLAGIQADPTAADGTTFAFAVMVLSLSIFLSPLLPFDFRGDFDRMEGLKTLPIAPWRLALGQLATPTALMTTSQLLALILLAASSRAPSPAIWAFAAFAVPLNVVLLEVENLMFLWFPSRPMAHTPGDVQAMGRMALLMIAKMFVLAVAAGAASLLGAIGYLVGGWLAALALAWLSLMGLAVLFVPAIAAAFARFDVASETPA